MMNFFDLDRWNEVWQTIARNRKRSVMTAFGVFWGVFMLVVLLSFGMGLGDMFKANLGDMSTNSAFVFSDQTSVAYKGMPVGRWWKMTMDDIENVKKIEGVRFVAPIFWGFPLKVTNDNKSGDFTFSGQHPNYHRMNPYEILQGRFINDLDEKLRRKVCVIGKDVAEQLFNNKSPIGELIQVGSSYYTVVGVIKLKNIMMNMGVSPEKSVLVPSSLYRQLMNYGEKIDAMGFTARDDADIDAILTEAKGLIVASNFIAPTDVKAVNGFSFSEEFKEISSLVVGVFSLTWLVGIGTLLAGIVGISNIMLVTVRERTQEIGVRRALGAKPRVILSQILSESFVLTFIAGILGLTSAVGLMSVLNPILSSSLQIGSGNGYFISPSFQISFGLGLSCAAIIIVGSLIAGIIPANRALKIKAVDAIREE